METRGFLFPGYRLPTEWKTTVRILIINWQDLKNPQSGGAEVHLHEVFSRIARMGHEVVLYCSMFPGAAAVEDMGGIRVCREGGRYLFNFRVPFAYLSRLRREKFDIVIDDMNKIPFFTPFFVREPLYGVTHHLFGESVFREINPILGAYVYLMEKAAVRYYLRKGIPFIVGSPSTLRELMERRFPRERIAVVNYAVDHAVHRMTGVPKSPTPLIGSFGRLKKYKSIDHFIRALPSVVKEFPSIKVVIAGDGDDRPRLEQIAREVGVASTVEFAGFISEERKVELLQQMWFKVATSAKEGWGLTVTEANACGTPVIASDVPGLRDAVRNNETGILYPYGDIDRLSNTILDLLRDTQLRERLTKNAIRWANTFTWDAAADQTLELLQRRIKEG
jgi:glycosyltransferase involved in cell wall biosynthesis